MRAAAPPPPWHARRHPGRLPALRVSGLAACSIQARLRPRSPLRAAHLRLSASSPGIQPLKPLGQPARPNRGRRGGLRHSGGLRPRAARGLHLRWRQRRVAPARSARPSPRLRSARLRLASIPAPPTPGRLSALRAVGSRHPAPGRCSPLRGFGSRHPAAPSPRLRSARLRLASIPAPQGPRLASIQAPPTPGRLSALRAVGSRHPTPGRLSPLRGFGLAAYSIWARLRPRSPLSAWHLRLPASRPRHPAPSPPLSQKRTCAAATYAPPVP